MEMGEVQIYYLSDTIPKSHIHAKASKKKIILQPIVSLQIFLIPDNTLHCFTFQI